MIEAGRELDALVAEKVMGWHKSENKHAFYDFERESWHANDGSSQNRIYFVNEWRPSTDIACAWEVVERLKSERHDFVIASYQQDGFKDWYVKINAKPEMYYIAQGNHSSAAHAICLCALQAVGRKDDK